MLLVATISAEALPPNLPSPLMPPSWPSQSVGSASELIPALLDVSIRRLVLEPGTYTLDSPLVITRDVVLEAMVPGTAVLDGQDVTNVLEITLMEDAGIVLRGLDIIRGRRAYCSDCGDQAVVRCGRLVWWRHECALALHAAVPACRARPQARSRVSYTRRVACSSRAATSLLRTAVCIRMCAIGVGLEFRPEPARTPLGRRFCARVGWRWCICRPCHRHPDRRFYLQQHCRGACSRGLHRLVGALIRWPTVAAFPNTARACIAGCCILHHDEMIGGCTADVGRGVARLVAGFRVASWRAATLWGRCICS